jgi:peptidoglycan/LPS O-acetylase OafA/YrhL
MLLSSVLRKENNNFDLFRVVAAGMVIYGHAYALLPAQGQQDIVARLLGFAYSGSLAVKIFFFLSGVVVTHSLMEKKDVRRFLVSRFFRIWPALAVVLAAWAFVLGPALSTHSMRDYFSSPAVYEYFLRGLLMDMRYELPGVFQGNAHKAANGSLWSIPFEVYAYLALIAVFLLGVLRSRPLSLALFLVILVDPVIGNKVLFTWLPQNPELTLIAPCFALGALLVLFKDRIEIHLAGFVGAWVLFYLFAASSFKFYFFYFAAFYSVLYLSSRAMVVRFKPRVDISYGLYLWGWPVQQVMAQFFPEHGIRFNQVASILVAALLGYASWRLVESRFVRLGSGWGRPSSSGAPGVLQDPGLPRQTP